MELAATFPARYIRELGRSIRLFPGPIVPAHLGKSLAENASGEGNNELRRRPFFTCSKARKMRGGTR